MYNKKIFRFGCAVLLIIFLVSSVSNSLSMGLSLDKIKKETNFDNYHFEKHFLKEKINKYFFSQKNIAKSIYLNTEQTTYYKVESLKESNPISDSIWPMKCHDLHHTSRSPYINDNSGIEKWRFRTDDCVEASPVVGNDGTIYVGDFDRYLYAINPDGTEKWRYKTGGWIWSAPAVADDGTIYVGSWDNFLYAINPNGTLKWKFGGGGEMDSSPAIGNDGTIYVGSYSHKLFAINPDGTEKWRYETGYHITSDPAIGNDGTIYIGSGDSYLYAINPNGTLKWRFKTDDDIKSHPSIGADGTIYIDSWDYYLYAVNPDGTEKWKIQTASGCGSAAIEFDGTIYIGAYDGYLYAINPDGTIKWSYKLDAQSTGHSSPAIGGDGTIYVCGGTLLFAVNPDGTELWRKEIGKAESSPVIGEDGTIYIGSGQDDFGYLHAFGAPYFIAEANGPYYGLIDEPVQFEGDAYKGVKPYTWLWDFGDGYSSDEQNPSHIYTEEGNYSVTLTVSDSEGNVTYDSSWAWVQDGNFPPVMPLIDGPVSGKPDQIMDFSFKSTDPEGTKIWYFVDWDDGSNTGWFGPYNSGTMVTLNHCWPKGVFTIKCKAKDVYDDESPIGTHTITVLKNKAMSFPLLSRFLERYYLLEEKLSHIIIK